jgi:hypothetical protein
MKIITKQIEIENDGVTYIITTFDDGEEVITLK